MSTVQSTEPQTDVASIADSVSSLERRTKRSRNIIVALIAAMLVFTTAALTALVGGEAKTQIALSAKVYENELDAWVKQQSTIVEMYSHVIEADPSLVENYDEAVAWLHSVKLNYPDISVCYLNDTASYRSITDNGYMPPDDFDMTTREWYIGARSTDDTYVTEPYIDVQTGLPCCTISRAVYGEDGYIGVFAVDYFLDKLVSIMDSSYTDSEYAFLVAPDGAIVNHPNPAYQLSEESVTNIRDTEFAPILDAQDAVRITDYAGRSVLCVAAYDSASRFTLVVARDSWSIYGPILPIAISLIATFAICTVLVYLLSRRLLAAHADANRRLDAARKQAERANSAKTEFLSRISHDIRTPIGAILNLTDFAKRDLADGEAKALEKDIADIDSSGTYLLSLINDVLDISKIDSGRIELRPEPFDCEDYLTQIRTLMDSLGAEKGLHFVVDAQHSDAHYVMVDPVRLRQIALNLLSNAAKFSPEGGTITYSSHAAPLDDSHLLFTFSVADEGIGMSDEFQERMFEEFAQEVDNPEHDAALGTGLGLAIVKRMVDLMDGTIEVESALGRGTTIEVSLPLQITDGPAAPREQGEVADESAVPAGLHVLLAEDNLINTEIAKRIFSEMGATVEHAANGAEAVSLFERSAIGELHAVFMDIQMPTMNGFEAAAAIRALDRADAAMVPIIAMTADAYAEAQDKATDSGMSAFLTKPLEPEKIAQTLRELAAQSASS